MTIPMMPQGPNRDYLEEDEIDLKQLFRALMTHKWTILLTAMLSMLLASSYLYMTPTSYESFSIVDVKTKAAKKIMPQELMLGGLSDFSNDEVDKEMALYKTFFINKKVLETVPRDVQYFVRKEYKKIELYGDSPISITNLNILNNDIISKKITISPVDEKYFSLKITENGLFNYFKKPILEQTYRYGATIQTDYFVCDVTKNASLMDSYIIKFNGSKRDIYENIIKSHLTISREDKKSSLIKIAFRDTVPERAEAYVNALAEIFSKQNKLEKSEMNNKVLESINSQLAELKVSLSKSEDAIEGYKLSQNIIKPDKQSTSLIDKLSKIDFDLTQAQMKHSIISKINKSAARKKNIDAIALSLSELGSQKISSLFDALQMAQVKESELSLEFKKSFPALKKVRLKIKNLENKIKSSVNSLQHTLANKITSLKKTKEKTEAILKTLPEKERKLVNFNRNYGVNAKMYTYLLQLKAEKTIAQSSILSDFRVVDNAYTDKASQKPKGMLILVVAGITGLILGIFISFFREFMDDNIRDIESIERETTLPVYGFIPLLKNKSLRTLEVLEHKHSEFSESFREIRNNVRASYGMNDSTIIMVTSTVSTEGKTVISSNLAGILSLTDAKCIIINLDLRKPMLHRHFGIENDRGMSEYLQNQNSLEEVIHKTQHKGIDIIPAGKTPQHPSELILKDELRWLLSSLRETYDYIIIDSAPIGLVSDAKELMHVVDLNLFVIRDGVSKKGYIKNLNQLIKTNRLNNVALAVNGIKKGNGQYGYGSQYGYGYGYHNAYIKSHDEQTQTV